MSQINTRLQPLRGDLKKISQITMRCNLGNPIEICAIKAGVAKSVSSV